ncbi:MAG: hypothetical protein EOO20_25115 [Chryseobacterium sp.]|nr:MAG: hypothetical protein EOO20_25115 [Chryseobacterium sp.]
MENKEKKDQDKNLQDENLEKRTGSDADADTGKTTGEFANIGKKQAGENNTEEEIKGSDADRI